MNLLNKLIEQAKNPNGVLGSFMLKIMNSAHIEMNKWALEKINMRKESVMLDVGCGGGKTLQLLSKMNADGQIYGIDYSEQAVKDSIRANKLDVATGKVHIQQASVTDIPFPENAFDIITAFQTHYFWSDLESSVKEVFRVLQQEGCFFIIAEIYKINYHMKAYKTKEEMAKLLKTTGFNTVECYVNPNKKWICIKAMK
ncbi:class I SAM-dependent methyltransferase [Lysinibacillus sp. KU-BSD001]|uniref:class I SAM-dependent methyltransferase n=1 Tax=Lysinibacillus sp. KU-BSD001 TaxID=3141328 RepID=UPI0036EF3AFF